MSAVTNLTHAHCSFLLWFCFLAEIGCVIARKPTFAEVKNYSSKLTMLKPVAKMGRKTRSSSQRTPALRTTPALDCAPAVQSHKDFAYKHIVPLCKCRTLFPILSCPCGLCLQSTSSPTSCKHLGRPGSLSACSWAV